MRLLLLLFTFLCIETLIMHKACDKRLMLLHYYFVLPLFICFLVSSVLIN